MRPLSQVKDFFMRDEKTSVAALSILSNTTLVLFKLTAGILTNSVSIISEAIHSGLDLLAALIAFASVRVSGNPPDNRHRYGHGKFENISGTIEALLIFIAAVWIIVEAYNRIISGGAVETLTFGLVAMGVSVVVNIFVSNLLMKTAKKTDSVALEADALHLRTDVYTSLGVLIGLGVIAVTEIHILDPLIAIGVALLIFKASWDMTVKAFLPLLDVALPAEEEEEILKAVKLATSDGIVEIHKLRTRRAGAQRYVDMHLVVPRELSFIEVHDLCDQVEKSIKERLPMVNVLVHAEPCEGESCSSCEGLKCVRRDN